MEWVETKSNTLYPLCFILVYDECITLNCFSCPTFWPGLCSFYRRVKLPLNNAKEVRKEWCEIPFSPWVVDYQMGRWEIRFSRIVFTSQIHKLLIPRCINGWNYLRGWLVKAQEISWSLTIQIATYKLCVRFPMTHSLCQATQSVHGLTIELLNHILPSKVQLPFLFP